MSSLASLTRKATRLARLVASQPIGTLGIIANELRLVQARKLMLERVNARPQSLQLETSSVCNLRCRMCGINRLSKVRQGRHMGLDEVREALSQVPTVRSVVLHGIGEPLLNPQIAEIIAFCTKKGLKVRFFTNGTVLDEAKAVRIIESGLSRLVVSMDSANAETFEDIRVGAKFEQVVENVKRFVSIRREMGRAHPELSVMAIAMERNVGELKDIIHLAKEIGADSVTLKGLNTGDQPRYHVPGQITKDVKAYAADIEKGGKFHVHVDFDRRGGKETRCRWPWTSTYITAEGEVTPCCNCPDAGILSFGNIYHEPFDGIWNNAAYQRFRRELHQGTPEICRPCADY